MRQRRKTIAQNMGVTQPSLDEFLELLADRRRRYALYCLDEADETVVSLEELSDQVVQRERNWDDDGTPAEDHGENVRIELHHNHLPRLSDAGLIDYDSRTKTVNNREGSSLIKWVQNDVNELPHLRALFTTTRA